MNFESGDSDGKESYLYYDDLDGGVDDSYDEYYSDLYYTHEESPEPRLADLVQGCLYPAASEAILHFLGPILLANVTAFVLVRFTRWYFERLTKASSNLDLLMAAAKLDHFVLIATGAALLRYYFALDVKFFHYLAVIAILLALLVPLAIRFELPRSLLWLVCLALVGLNETIILCFDSSFFKLRANLMLLVMKSISYYQDTLEGPPRDPKRRFSLDCLDVFSYLLHPCTLITGVWHPDPRSQVNDVKSLTDRLVDCAKSLALSTGFLLGSVCLIHFFLDQSLYTLIKSLGHEWLGCEMHVPLKYLRAYSTAVQFHFSHYFICFAAQAMFDLWAIRLTVTRPMLIELPRSLVDVVVAWNIPMHKWLKKYVFQPLKLKLNIYSTILATYLISSYLHGFCFHIWAVLLTLGLLTQAEFKLRKKLSRVLSACIESRTCKYFYYYDPDQPGADGLTSTDEEDLVPNVTLCTTGGHHYTHRNWLVRFINHCWTVAAWLNLAFLGSTFDGDPESSTASNVWAVWSDLYFHSYLAIAAMFLVYQLLRYY